MKTYVTFGLDHIHKINHKIFDHNCVAEIKGGREEVFRLFGPKFCFEYSEKTFEFSSVEKYYPRGIISVELEEEEMVSIEDEKNDALKVYILWAWLEKNPRAVKEDYPLFSAIGLDLHTCPSYCPWCDRYYSDSASIKDECRGCPLDTVRQKCDSEDADLSWWGIWTAYRPEKRAEAAGNIATVAWNEYKRLGG